MATYKDKWFMYGDRRVCLTDLLPEFLKPIYDFRGMANISCEEIEPLYNGVASIEDDQFLTTASESRIERLEKALKIVPNATDSLGERRVKVFSKMNDYPPYTDTYLVNKLNTICGNGRFTITRNYDNYELVIDISNDSYIDGKSLTEMVRSIVPSNMIVTVNETLNSGEESSLDKVSNVRISECCPSIVKITWNAVDGADSYDVEHSMDTVTWELVKSTTTCEMNIAGVVDDVPHYYRVRATSGAKYGLYSENKVVTTYGMPEQVKNFTITQSSQHAVNFKWDAVENCEVYQVLKYNNDGTWDVILETKTNNASYSKLTPEITHIFAVCACRKLNGIVYQNAPVISTITMKPYIGLNEIAGMDAYEDSFESIKVEWSSNWVNGAEHYILQRSTDSIKWTTIATVSSTDDSYYSDTDLNKNVTYYYRLRAENANVVSEYSTSSATAYGYPEKIKNFQVISADRYTVTFTWEAPPYCDEYTIMHRIDNVNWEEVATLSAFDINDFYVGGLRNHSTSEYTEPGGYVFAITCSRTIGNERRTSEMSDTASVVIS